MVRSNNICIIQFMYTKCCFSTMYFLANTCFFPIILNCIIFLIISILITTLMCWLLYSLLSQPEPCGSSWSLSVFSFLPSNGKNPGLLESKWRLSGIPCRKMYHCNYSVFLFYLFWIFLRYSVYRN